MGIFKSRGSLTTTATVELAPKNSVLPFEHLKHTAGWGDNLRALLTASRLPDQDLEDSMLWHKDYWAFARERRLEFWAQLFAITMKYECNYNPKLYSVDAGVKNNKATWSVGLMQMSVIDQTNYDLGFGYSFTDLQNPLNNMRLAVAIAERLVTKDGCLAAKANGRWRGMAKYWGTLREGRSTHRHIQTYMQALKL